MKKILTFVFAASIFGIANAATSIGTSAAFKKAMETDPTGDYVLTADIDLTGSDYSSVASFSGSLDGTGHTISGLGAQALFQDCSGAVTNLTIDGTVGGANTERTKTGCGVFADTATGATFVGCVVKGYKLIHDTKDQGQIVGNGFIVGTAGAGCLFERCLAESGCVVDQNGFGGNSEGGIVGLMLIATTGDSVLGRFSACTNRAQIASTSGGNGSKGGLGGIAGYVWRSIEDKKTVPTVEFDGCVNEGDIVVAGDTSETMLVGGIAGHTRSYNSSTFMRVTFANCINRGALATDAYSGTVGGMVGLAEEFAYASFDSCVNRGNLGALKIHFVGGILGRCARLPTPESVVMVNCANYGKLTTGCTQVGKYVTLADSVGGLIGVLDGVKINGGDLVIRNSANYGELAYDTAKDVPMIGELAGNVTNENNKTGTVTFDNCWRKGEKAACGSNLETITVTTTHEQTAATAAATAVQNLNAVAKPTADYVQWGVGSSGYPELYVEGALGPEPEPVAALSDPTASLARNGQSVTCSVEVASVTVEGGVLRLVVNGKTVKSWTLAAGKQEHVMSLKLGTTYAYSFVAEEATPSPYTTVSVDGGSFTAIGEADWFDVKFADAGYVPGATWMADSTDKSGGTWSGVAGETELDADTRTVSFVATPTAPVYYAPKSASKARAGVVINGKMLVDESTSLPPADVPFALGFELDTTAMAFKPIVYANGVKSTFGTASLGWKSMADFTVEGKPTTDDNLTWQLRVTIDSMVSDWLTVTVAKGRVSSLGFSGGAFGDLGGVCKLYKNNSGLIVLIR